jgi:hypothetical protein
LGKVASSKHHAMETQKGHREKAKEEKAAKCPAFQKLML